MKKQLAKISALTLIFVTLDQFSKILVVKNLPFSKNFGIAFGIPIPYYLLISVTIALLVVLVYVGIKEFKLEYSVTRLLLAMILGGGIANLIDRLNYGYVVDFIAIGWWPSFNLADSFITVGILLLLTFYAKIKQV